MKKPRLLTLSNFEVPDTKLFIFLTIIMIVFFALCGVSYAEPLTLNDALKIAMENNPVIKSMKAEYFSLKSARQVVEAENNLSASVTDFLGKRNMQMINYSAPGIMPSTVSMLPDNNWNSANLTLMMPLYTGGLINSSVKSALYKEKAGEKNITAIENEVAFLVKVKYFELLFKTEETKIYSRLVNLEKEQLRIAEDLFKQGKISLLYNLRAKNELARAQQELNNKTAEKEIVFSELKKVLGKNQDYDLTICDSLSVISFDMPLSECVKTALSERPDLKTVENNLKSANEEIKRAGSLYSPQVYLMGMYDYKNNIDHGYSLSAVASLPIFDSGSRKFKVEEAKNNQEKVLSLKKDTELNIEQEIVKVTLELKAARENVALSEAAVAEAEEVYKIAKLKFEERKGIYIEILDALLNLTSAHTRRYEAIYKNNIAVAELYLKMGRK